MTAGRSPAVHHSSFILHAFPRPGHAHGAGRGRGESVGPLGGYRLSGDDGPAGSSGIRPRAIPRPCPPPGPWTGWPGLSPMPRRSSRHRPRNWCSSSPTATATPCPRRSATIGRARRGAAVRQVNGGTQATLLAGVQEFSLSYQKRSLTVPMSSSTGLRPSWPATTTRMPQRRERGSKPLERPVFSAHPALGSDQLERDPGCRSSAKQAGPSTEVIHVQLRPVVGYVPADSVLAQRLLDGEHAGLLVRMDERRHPRRERVCRRGPASAWSSRA